MISNHRTEIHLSRIVHLEQWIVMDLNSEWIRMWNRFYNLFREIIDWTRFMNRVFFILSHTQSNYSFFKSILFNKSFLHLNKPLHPTPINSIKTHSTSTFQSIPSLDSTHPHSCQTNNPIDIHCLCEIRPANPPGAQQSLWKKLSFFALDNQT